MANYEHVVIVGVGLLGGSIGMALRERGLAKTVVGVGRDASKLQNAVDLGAIDSFTQDLATACKNADLAIVCTPVQLVGSVVCDCLNWMPDGLVTDVGSTKATICHQVSQGTSKSPARFVGSHPLAGSEKVGVQFARADLFDGRTCVVTPSHETPPADLQQTCELWQLLGSRTVTMDPHAHDAAIARTSHVPHIVASALSASTPDEVLGLAASGWVDTTRIAAGNPDLWQQIISENRMPVIEALTEFTGQLNRWIEAIKRDDSAAIQKLLELGKRQRDSVGN